MSGTAPGSHQIRVREVPLWMSIRDVLLTLCAWGIIVYFLREALYLAYDYLRYPYFELVNTKAPDLQGMWSDLRKFLILAVCLMLWLVFWAINSIQRLRSAAMVRQPAPLSLQEEAASVGVPEEQLMHGKSNVISTVFFDSQHRVTEVRAQGKTASITPGMP